MEYQPEDRAVSGGPVVFAVLLGILCLCYLPALITPYALSDDYAVLSAFRFGVGASFEREIRIASGRPVLAFLADLFFRFIPNIGGLRYVRLLSLIFVALLAWSIYQAAKSTGHDRRTGFLVAVIVVTLPPFQILMSWASNASYFLAALTAGAALYGAEWALRTQTPSHKWRLVAASILLMLLAITNFQPGAMFFWVFAVLVMFKPSATASGAVRRLLWYGGIAAAGLVLGFLVYKLGMLKYGYLESPMRSHLSSDPLAKVNWFVQLPVRDALNLIKLNPSSGVAIGVGVFVSAGLMLYFQGGLGERLCKYALALVVVPLSYLPNLVVAENWSSYRTQIALTPLILVYCYFALCGYTRLLLSRRAAEQVLIAVLSLSAVTSVLVAAYNMQTYFAIPQMIELALMRSQIASGDLAVARSIYIIGAQDSIAPLERYDEFGVPFSAAFWGASSAAYLLLHEVHPVQDSIPIQVAPVEGPINPPPDALVVDMRKLAYFRR